MTASAANKAFSVKRSSAGGQSMDRLVRNKKQAMEFYDLMFNQNKPAEAIERSGARVVLVMNLTTEPGETDRFGGKPGQLAQLWRETGLRDVVEFEGVLAGDHPLTVDLQAGQAARLGPPGHAGRRAELGAARRPHPDRHLPRRPLRGPPARRRPRRAHRSRRVLERCGLAEDLLDGLGRITELVDTAAQLGMDSMAITAATSPSRTSPPNGWRSIPASRCASTTGGTLR